MISYFIYENKANCEGKEEMYEKFKLGIYRLEIIVYT